MRTPLITAIVSTYNSARFMKGCLDDLLGQSIARDMEILVIDSGSQQDEARICKEYMHSHPGLRYVRTERESLYAAWNRAVRMATGKYLTSANTDDRHRCDALERLVTELENHPDHVLAYGDQYSSHIPNETYEECARRGTKVLRFPDYQPAELMLRCIGTSQPVWRLDAHKVAGYFDTSFRIAGDYEFWMRLAQTGDFRHVNDVLGVFYDAPDTISGSNNHFARDLENIRIKRIYLDKGPWNKIVSLRKVVARETIGCGYRYVRKGQHFQAKQIIRESLRLDPWNPQFMKTYVLRCLLGVHNQN